MNFDLKITWYSLERKIQLILTDKTLDEQGQHGKATILEDEQGQQWLLKLFKKSIDVESHKINLLDVDIKANPEDMKDRLHLWRALNEFVASKLATELNLNVPEAILITSENIFDLNFKPDDELPLPEDEIILDEDHRPETAEEYYKLSLRENYKIESSKKFEEIITDIGLGVLIKYIPNSMNLEKFMEFDPDFSKVIASVSKLDNGFNLLPFDVWLNDPDRNQGNYLIQLDNEDKPKDVWGLDYEMWAMGNDIWMDEDEITKGRSYLTAFIHKATNILDPRILETFFKISAISNKELKELTLAPQIICQYIEYHIQHQNLNPDERIKLLNIEQNIWDFLYETRPNLDQLIIRIIKQIGFPEKLSSLENKIVKFTNQEDDEDHD